MIKICVQCGRKFEPRHPLRELCSPECQHLHRVEWDHKHYLEKINPNAGEHEQLDYLAHLEATYGKLPNGKIKRMILDWRDGDGN